MFIVPGVNAIHDAQAGFTGRDIRAHVSHDTDESHLTNVGAFTPHIRTSNYHSSPAITLERGEGRAVEGSRVVGGGE